MLPLVTVVLAVQNREAYVAESIDCVAKQRHEAIELIVVDDCSQDHSDDAIFKALTSDLCRRRFVNIVHKRFNRVRGLPKALHWGLKRAMGDYSTMLVAGDLYPSDRLGRLCEALDASEAEWAFTRVGCIDADGYVDDESEEAKRCARIQSRVGEHRSVAFTAMGQHLSLSPGGIFMESEFYRDAGRLRSLPHAYDWDFFLSASLISEPLFLPELAYFRRIQPVDHLRTIEKSEMREGPIALMRFFSRIQLDEVESALLAENPEFIKEFERESMRLGVHDVWQRAGNPKDVYEQTRIWLKDHI